ncbi:hypothetical protein BST81_02275 [Leptolyngbya sp. 'hensonii']|uniref:endonuclease NucS domain-containing protein n=1 Tax=Leptolyngbya sp. 'hensonii' TaxID=1922337 RepID=UPI00094FE237|nr:endonuclease NucS domain-containing protein [Leptolyngbya sp. 'hensonii']OLP20085.1 hypothetical protein BST81_02275 [Leptolyngbya sp. 'hensonii']
MSDHDRNPTTLRLRVYGDVAEFETERHLEWFFWHTVLAQMGLTPLKSQYNCREGVCDILARGANKELVIIELKNTQDSHVVEQITAYFDALIDERPFDEQIDYSQPIALYTICPSYSARTELTLKYHKLGLTLFTYSIIRWDAGFKFMLWQWPEPGEVLQVEIPAAPEVLPHLDLPDPPRSFVNLLGKCTDAEKHWAIRTRDQTYEFARNHKLKIAETPDGKWTRFERTKQYPIAELGWDNKRDELAIFLWLPFMTVNGQWNMGGPRSENFKKTAMMRLWIVNDQVTCLAYVENGRKSWLIVTKEEIETGKFSLPTKLRKWMQYTHSYWKGLAMPVQFYLETMELPDRADSLSSFVELALEHSLQRLRKSKSSPNQQASASLSNT